MHAIQVIVFPIQSGRTLPTVNWPILPIISDRGFHAKSELTKAALKQPV